MGIIERITAAFRPSATCEGCGRDVKLCKNQCPEAAALDAEWMKSIR